jgi:predicted metal-binding membrane protein
VTTAALPRPRRSDAGLVVVLAVTGAAWVLTAGRMSGMDDGPGTDLGSIGWFTLTWLVMMAAMMLPALTPMVAVYARHVESRAASAAFAAGYLAAWLCAGLVGYLAIEAVRALQLGVLAWDEAGRYLAAAVVVGAGLYQLTASKTAFLRRCCERRAFVRDRWRPGRRGALSMGMEHGTYCVGSSWGLMAALFALGAMSLTWMALVAVLIAAERLVPRFTRVAVALVFVVLGSAVALAPGQVPELTVPGSTSMPQTQMR